MLYDKLPIILSKNLGFKLYTQIIMYLVVFLSPYISIISSMLGTILFITRFDYNLQLTAIKSLGIGFRRILISLTLSFFFLGALIGWFINSLSPYFKKKCYDIFRNLDNLDPALNIKPNVFINDIPDLGIYIGDKNGENLNNIVVYTHNKDVDSLFLAKSGTINSDHSTKLMSIKLNNGFNFCEGDFFNNLIKTDKNLDRIDIRNRFKEQNIYIDMKDILKMQSFYESLSDISSSRIFELLKTDKDSINKNVDIIMDSINNDYRYIFDEISEKKESILKNKIRKSLLNNSFSNNVFNKADEVKKNNIKFFNKIDDHQYNIKRYYMELFRRNSTILGCFLMMLIGCYIGFYLKRGVMILPIIIGALFVSIYFLGESLFINFIQTNSYLYLFRRSGGSLTMIILIFLYLMFYSFRVIIYKFKARNDNVRKSSK